MFFHSHLTCFCLPSFLGSGSHSHVAEYSKLKPQHSCTWHWILAGPRQRWGRQRNRETHRADCNTGIKLSIS